MCPARPLVQNRVKSNVEHLLHASPTHLGRKVYCNKRHEAPGVFQPQSHYTFINWNNLNNGRLYSAVDAYSYSLKTNTIVHARPVAGKTSATDLLSSSDRLGSWRSFERLRMFQESTRRTTRANIPPDTTIKCNGDIIYPSKHVKNLGLYIDRYMLFDVHINELNRKVMGIVMYISRISHNFDKKTRIIIIQALVLSLVEYCIKIWGTTNNTLISSVQKLQNFAARVAVGGVRKYEHVSPAFMELKWLKVKQKHLLDVGITVFKVLRGFYPDWFLSFPSVEGVAGSVTRQRQQLHVPRTNTHTGDRCTTVLGATLWNTLPLPLKQSPTLTIFKTRIKEFLLTVNM